jgi:osmotically-inducible protein OsmY
MIMKKLAALVAVVALISGGLTACSSETKVDDTTITHHVKSKMSENASLTGANIEVVTVGGVVTLTGAVDNKEQEEAAKTAAKSIKGVHKVDSKLTIKGH